MQAIVARTYEVLSNDHDLNWVSLLQCHLAWTISPLTINTIGSLFVTHPGLGIKPENWDFGDIPAI